jgi:tetratricopeptide (TPR) repeat protein
MRSEEFWKWFEGSAAPLLDGWQGMHRAATFRKMFEHLDGFDRKVTIIETGCIEGAAPDNWRGNGCSTILFDKYAETHPGCVVHSAEIIEAKIEAAKKLCPLTTFHLGDSVESLRKLAHELNGVDLLFLDATHLDWRNETPSGVHHFNELMAAMPLVHERTLVAVDDSISVIDDYPVTKIAGKGCTVAQYALEIGAVLEFCQYQIGFTRMTGRYPGISETAPPVPPNIAEVLAEARGYVEAGRVEAADRLYRLILATTIVRTKPAKGEDPHAWAKEQANVRVARGEAYANFGRTGHKLRYYGRAVDWFRFALEVDPKAAEYRCDLARALVALGAMHSGKREATIATEIEPDNPHTWQTLGGVESDMRNEAGAIIAYDREVEAAERMSPRDDLALSDAYINRAVLAVDGKDYPKARALCRNIVELGVRKGDAWHILALIEYRLSNHEEAIKLFDMALEADCRNQPLAHWNKSLPLQSIGRFREAFEEHAWGEQELTVTAIYVPQRRFSKPRWHGEHDCVVHVHTEAGHGDNIQMLRYLPLFKEIGCEVRYESDAQLLSLAQRSFPDVPMIPRSKDYPGVFGVTDFDYHIPIGNLPHAFKTDIDTIPWRGPYLKADDTAVARTAKLLPPTPTGGRKIGVCWSSGIRTDMNIWMEKYGRMKSMRFSDVEPIITNGLDTFVSLQVGDGRDEQRGAIIDVLPEKPTWDDTAALIENLDLVITVDTGVAHLAGAMGIPTWVMMQRDGASWHFLCWRPGASWNEASPWYPSIRVFRQHRFNEPGQWADVVRDVVEALGDVENRTD